MMRTTAWIALLAVAPMARAQGGDDDPRTKTLLGAVSAGAIETVRTMLEEGANPHDTSGGFGQLPLEVAMENGRDDIAELLIEHIDDLDAPMGDLRQMPPLFVTVRHPKFARLLLDKGADVRARDAMGNGVLHHAILVPETRALFLRRGAPVDAPNRAGERPVVFAVRADSLDAVKFALDHGADLRARPRDRQTLLHVAARFGALDVARFLIEQKHDIEARDASGHTPIVAAVGSRHTAVVKLLLEAGADVEPGRHASVASALNIAARNGDVALADLLVAHGADPKHLPGHGNTPLAEAVIYGHAEMIGWLIERGADIRRRIHGLPLLCFANAPETVRLLLDRGCRADAAARNGMTPLHSLAARGRTAAVDVLIAAGARIEATDANHTTPLMHAVMNGNLETVRLLVERGANANVRDAKGRTPLIRLAWLDKPELAKLLIDAGVDVNARDVEKTSALHLAAKHGHLEMVEALLHARANRGVPDGEGKTPRDHAVAGGFEEIAALLRGTRPL